MRACISATTTMMIKLVALIGVVVWATLPVHAQTGTSCMPRITHDTPRNSDCGTHGTWKENRCECTNPTPAVGQAGYVGKSCEIRTWCVYVCTVDHHHTTAVYGAALDGTDVTANCTRCGSVPPKAWTCFYAAYVVPPCLHCSSSIPCRLPSQWNYLSVELARTSSDGDPDLCKAMGVCAHAPQRYCVHPM